MKTILYPFNSTHLEHASFIAAAKFARKHQAELRMLNPYMLAKMEDSTQALRDEVVHERWVRGFAAGSKLTTAFAAQAATTKDTLSLNLSYTFVRGAYWEIVRAKALELAPYMVVLGRLNANPGNERITNYLDEMRLFLHDCFTPTLVVPEGYEWNGPFNIGIATDFTNPPASNRAFGLMKRP